MKQYGLYHYYTYITYSTMSYFQCIIFSLIFGCVIIQGISGVARVKRSADENLRDPGTYIVHFQDNSTDTQQQHFVNQLIIGCSTTKFEAKIISEYPNMKCLTVKLSERSLKWVRMIC